MHEDYRSVCPRFLPLILTYAHRQARRKSATEVWQRDVSLSVTNCGPIILSSHLSSNRWDDPTERPQNKNKFKTGPSARLASDFWNENSVIFVKSFLREANHKFLSLYWKNRSPKFVELVHQEENHKCCSSMTKLGQTTVTLCTTEAVKKFVLAM